MTKEELQEYINSTREKLNRLEDKAFKEAKGKYPIIKNQNEMYRNDLDFYERNLVHDLDESTLNMFKESIDEINKTADLDLEEFIKESNKEDSVEIIAAAAHQEASKDEVVEEVQEVTTEVVTEETPTVDTTTVEEAPVVEQPAQEEMVAPEVVAETTEEVAQEVTTEEPVNELDQVDTQEIINSLDSEPEIQPIPQDLVNDMIAADGLLDTTETVEETAEVTPQELPTQEVDINAIDNILNTLEAQPDVTPVEETPVAEQPVQVEAPVAPEVVAAPEVAPVMPEAPIMEQPVVTAPQVEGPVLAKTI